LVSGCRTGGELRAAGTRAAAITDARFIPGAFRGLKGIGQTTRTGGRPA
jgi:hypothetical protein